MHMRITRLEAIPVVVPLKPHLRMKTSHGMHDESPYVIVRVHTDEGLVGLGEATVTPRWSGETEPWLRRHHRGIAGRGTRRGRSDADHAAATEDGVRDPAQSVYQGRRGDGPVGSGGKSRRAARLSVAGREGSRRDAGPDGDRIVGRDRRGRPGEALSRAGCAVPEGQGRT